MRVTALMSAAAIVGVVVSIGSAAAQDNFSILKGTSAEVLLVSELASLRGARTDVDGVVQGAPISDAHQINKITTDPAETQIIGNFGLCNLGGRCVIEVSLGPPTSF